ncbi:MAG: hypothetical protein IPK12_14390 [Gemmatimonadetes bacterium]|nr:hypothetical protein [Gemmatimonadota bacterium]
MRRLLAAASASLVVLAACSDSATQTESPIVPHAFDVAPPAPCPTIDQTRALLKELYAAGPRQAQLITALNTIRTRMAAGNQPGAQELVLLTTRSVIADFYAGVLIGGQGATTQAKTRGFINGLFCLAGLAQPNVSLDPDATAGVVGPTSPTTTLVTPTQFAGVQVPAGAAPKLTLIKVRRLPDAPTPLLTPLDQYQAFYEFEAFPPTTFPTDLTVGVCQADIFSPTDYARLRVAHNVGSQAVILPLVAAPFLDCTTLIGAAPFYPGLKGYASRGVHWMTNMVLPAPAYAMALGSCCIAGSTKSFSPFGAVDPLTVLTLDAPTTIPGAPGSSVPVNLLPRVFLKTPLGRPVPGATVTFTLNPGSDATIGGTSMATTSNGIAELGSWKLGTDGIPDTVYINVTPLANTTVQDNGQYYVAP